MMIKRLLFFFLMSVVGVVWAGAPVTKYAFMRNNGQPDSGSYDSLSAVCGAWAVSPYGPMASVTGRTGWTCSGTTPPVGMSATGICAAGQFNCTAGTPYTTTGQAFMKQVCADGSAPNTSLPLDQQCSAPPPSCPKDQVSEDYFPANGKGSGFPVCSMAGCTVNITYVGGCVGPTSTGETACLMRGKTTGTVCNSMTDNSTGTNYGPGQEKPSGGTRTDMPTTKSGGKAVPCPQGTVQGGIDADGVPLCIGSGADPKNPPVAPPTTTGPPVTTQNADGSSTTTQTTTQQNSDGSTTTTVVKTIVGADGAKTVSQTQDTGKSTSGGQGKMDTPNADQTNLCKQNPQLAICQNSTVSGDCSAGAAALVCTGDAVQCAQLRYSAELACRERQDLEDLKANGNKSLGDSILSGADPKKADIDNLLKGTEVDLSKPNLDQSGFLGGGSCLANRNFTVLGQTVTMDFSTVCNNILPFRAGIMLCAFIVAYMLVSRSVLQS